MKLRLGDQRGFEILFQLERAAIIPDEDFHLSDEFRSPLSNRLVNNTNTYISVLNGAVNRAIREA